MPKQKKIRERTNCVRRRPIRDQEQYRHSHGLNTHEVSLGHYFQVEMTSTAHAKLNLCNGPALEIICVSSPVRQLHLPLQIYQANKTNITYYTYCLPYVSVKKYPLRSTAK